MFKYLSLLRFKVCRKVSTLLTKLKLYYSSVDFKRDLVAIGKPTLDISSSSLVRIGYSVKLISDRRYSVLGRCNPCKISVAKGAKLIIGNKVGMSNVTIISYKSVSIGNNILLGGGVTIVDTDFHSTSSADWHTDDDIRNMRSSPVNIGNNVFIGMDSIILKGVNIGDNVIVGAGSVVTKDIPANEIWAGNPAKYVKNR
ncbi:acyltransferase [Sphingobacterium siyangense]|uniref:acyltransferase n=1 Tax=Sphingobacterium siyangense TaxID=459529 RepID=UPI003DA65E82